MKEKLYTIPINEAFERDCECPVCAMYKILENNAVEYTMGPSYMEDDVRMETDRLGFCKPHMKMLLAQENKLGLALILKTHFDKTNKEVEKRMKLPVSAGGRSLFHKKTESSNPLVDYAEELGTSCFICQRIENTFERYLHTILVLWKTDDSFREKYKQSKGFCTEHMKDLLKQGEKVLSKSAYEEFHKTTVSLYLENMKRVADDLEWFINKFDYRYDKEPWKNAKDSVQRAVIKTNGIIELEEEKKSRGY